MTTLTQTQYYEVQALLAELVEVDRQEKAAADRKAAARARLLEIVEPLAAETPSPLPGVTVAVKRDVKYDTTEALTWALNPANILGAASFLRVRSDMTATMIQLVLQNDLNPAVVFDLDAAGYAAGVREASHVGMPFTAVKDVSELRVSIKALQLGEALAAHVTIVPDEANEAEVAHAD